MADRDVIQVEALFDFRTAGMPDSSYTHPNEPIVLKGQTAWVTKAQRKYLGTMVKLVGQPDPVVADYAAHNEDGLTPYARQASPLPHIYEPGKSTGALPDKNFVEARLAATTQEITFKQDGSPFGTGHADHPELYEREVEVQEAPVEEVQRSRRVKDVADPANT